jgi:hypothetical protein
VKSAVSEFSLLNICPNPFNPATTIGFTLPEATHVMLSVYDGSGRQATKIFNNRVVPVIMRPASMVRIWQTASTSPV